MDDRQPACEAESGNPPGWRHRFKPAVDGKVLILIAGLMWIGVGAMLLTTAASWLRADGDEIGPLWLVAPGALAALVIHHLGFLRIVDRNLGRITRLEGKRCVFSFMPLRSYAMVAVMIAMGVALRHSPLPKPGLAVLYIAMGGALILSAVRYLRVLVQGLWASRGQTER